MRTRPAIPLILVWILAVAVVAATKLNPFEYDAPAWMEWWLGVSIVSFVWLLAVIWALLTGVRTGLLSLLSAPLVLWFGGEAISWYMGWLVW